MACSVLLCMGLFDELMSGFPTIALPLLRDRLGLSYTQIGFLFTAGTLSSLVFEPLINLLSDRGSKKPWILGGLLMLTLSSLLSSIVTSYPLLLLAFIVFFPACGAGVGLAEAALIDFSPGKETRLMARWTLLSSVGDFLSPLVVAAFVVLGLGWPALCWLGAALWFGTTALLFFLRFPITAPTSSEEENEEKSGPWVSLRAAVRDPLLLRWSVLSIIPLMLDEIFLGFISLYLHDILHLNEDIIALIISLHMLAAFLGLLLLDRVLKRRPLAPVPTLFWSALVTALGVISLLLLRTLWSTLISLFIISFSAAIWYPLAQAEAYAQRPSQSGTVRAVIGLGAPFEMALPGIVGLVAASFGVLSGVALLGLAPVLVLLCLPYRNMQGQKRLTGRAEKKNE